MVSDGDIENFDIDNVSISKVFLLTEDSTLKEATLLEVIFVFITE